MRFVKPLAALAGPNMIAFASELVIPIVPTIFLRRSADEQAALVLGQMYCNALGISVVAGLAMGLDSLAPQANGHGDKHLVGLYTQRGICISLLALLPVSLVWLFCRPVLIHVLRIDDDLAELAARFVWARLPGLPAVVLFELLRRFAQAQRVAWPVMVVCCVVAVIHGGVCWWFLVANKGSLLAAGFATSIAMWLLALGMAAVLVVLRNSEQMRGSWRTPSRAELFAGWGQFLSLSLPAACSLFFEWGGWEVYSAIAASVGVTALAAQSILNVMASLMYIFPLGLAQAGATLLGTFLGEGKPDEAKKVAFFTLAVVLTYSVINGGLAILYARVYAEAMSVEEPVQSLTAKMFWILWIYGVFDHLKCVGMALLRSTGRPAITLYAVLGGMVVVGYPLAFGLKSVLGLAGVWIGSTAAWVVASSMFVVVLLRTDWDHEVAQAQKQIEIGKNSSAASLEQQHELVSMMAGESDATDDEEGQKSDDVVNSL